MRNAVLFTVFMVVLSGCTSGGTTTDKPLTTEGSYGLIITEFSTDLPTIEEGDTATLLLSFENVDQQTAKDIWGKVYAVGLSGTKTEETLGELEANNSDFFEFDLKAPGNLNIDRSYTPYAELCYNYKDSGSTSMFVVDQDIYSVNNVPELSSSGTTGPVQVNPSFSTDIVKIPDGESREKTLNIELTNVDNGLIYSGYAKKEGNKNELVKGGLVVKVPKTTGSTITVIDNRNVFECANSEEELNSLGSEVSVTANLGSVFTVGGQSFTLQDVASSSQAVIVDSKGGSHTISTSLSTIGGLQIKVNSADVISTPKTATFGVVVNSITNPKADSSNALYCRNLLPLSFGSSGSGKTERLTFNVTIDNNGQDIPFFIAEASYRYCIQTEPITINAVKVS